MAATGRVRSVDKGLLKNIIRHTDAHNKIQEQNEMWKQWELKKQAREQSHKYDDRKRGYMRSDLRLSAAAKRESLKWNRILLEYEETRSDRWGHGGYKELYPDEFQQEDCEAESDQSIGNEKTESKDDSSKTKRKNKKKDRSKKTRKLGAHSTDSENVRNERSDKRKKTDKRRKRERDTGKKELNDGPRISNVDQEKTLSDFNKSRDRKIKTSSDSGSKNRRDNKRTFDEFSRGVERCDKKKDTGVSTKCSRTNEGSHNSKRKKKTKH